MDNLGFGLDHQDFILKEKNYTDLPVIACFPKGQHQFCLGRELVQGDDKLARLTVVMEMIITVVPNVT